MVPRGGEPLRGVPPAERNESGFGGSTCIPLTHAQVKVEGCALEENPSWSFEHIKVSFEQLANGQALNEEAFFNGPCTLDTSTPEATLTASRESVWCSYKLTIWTASTKHAGTDGNIQLQIEGSQGTSAVLKVLFPGHSPSESPPVSKSVGICLLGVRRSLTQAL